MRAGRIFLYSLVLAVLCMGAFYLLVPQLLVGAEPSFDARMGGYDPATARTYLAYLEERELIGPYLTFFRWIDTAFPLAIFGLLISSIWAIWARPAPAIAVLGALVAIGYAVADYVENAAVASVLRAGSADVTAEAVNVASAATQGKWVAVFGALLLIGAGVLVTLVRGSDR
jgi:hypothetical protein